MLGIHIAEPTHAKQVASTPSLNRSTAKLAGNSKVQRCDRGRPRGEQGRPDNYSYTYGRPVVTRVELDTEQMTPKKRKSCRAHWHHQPCRRSG
jgi:hypothetical protein